MSANNRQVAGTHYTGGYQHWDLVADLRLGYFEGQVTKYVTRWRKKNGVQDLEKALHFLDKLLELTLLRGWGPRSAFSGFTGIRPDGSRVVLADLLSLYAKANDLSPKESEVIFAVACWGRTIELQQAHEVLTYMINSARMLNVTMVDSGEPGPGYVNQG